MRHRVSNWSWHEAILAAFAGLFLIGGGWLSATTQPAPQADGKLAARGALVFRRERCVFCHTLKDEGRSARMTDKVSAFRPLRVPSSSPIGPDLSQEGGRRTDDWHLAHLIDPPAVVAGSAMPSFAGLPQADLQALIVFLQSQGRWPESAGTPEAMPEIADSLENYRVAKALYLSHCAGCHGEGGNGIGVVGHLLRPEPRDFSDVAWMSKLADARLFAVVADGIPQTAMPGYRDSLSPAERALVVRYLRYFADPSAKQYLEQGLPRPGLGP